MPLFFHPLIVRSGAGLPERWSGYWDISAETGSALHIYGDRRYSAILDLYANRVRHRSPGGTLLLLDTISLPLLEQDVCACLCMLSVCL